MKLIRFITYNRTLVMSFLAIFGFLFLTPVFDIYLSYDDIDLQYMAMITRTADISEEPLPKYTYNKENVAVCSSSSVKTYMSYKAITTVSSAQYKYIKDNMYVDTETGLLRNKEHPEYIGVALGTYYGKIGSMFEFTLDTGKVLKVVKVDTKSDSHTYNGCYHRQDGSVIELVIDTSIARQYYGSGSNGYILNGNFNNSSDFSGKIVSVERVNVVSNF